VGLNDEGVLRPAIVIDIETAPIDGAASYLEEPTAPSNYVKQKAIDRYVAKAKEEQLGKCSLDPDLARIVAIGTHQEGCDPIVTICKNQNEERKALADFWHLIEPYPFPKIIGYNVVGFDVPMLLRRSLYLNVKAPALAINNYRHPDLIDLMMEMSFDGTLTWRGLDFYVKRFGLTVPDDPLEGGGAAIGKAVAEDRWDDVSAHCLSDVAKTVALARRLGKFK
jgi:hypothetical protein